MNISSISCLLLISFFSSSVSASLFSSLSSLSSSSSSSSSKSSSIISPFSVLANEPNKCFLAASNKILPDAGFETQALGSTNGVQKFWTCNGVALIDTNRPSLGRRDLLLKGTTATTVCEITVRGLTPNKFYVWNARVLLDPQTANINTAVFYMIQKGGYTAKIDSQSAPFKGYSLIQHYVISGDGGAILQLFVPVASLSLVNIDDMSLVPVDDPCVTAAVTPAPLAPTLPPTLSPTTAAPSGSPTTRPVTTEPPTDPATDSVVGNGNTVDNGAGIDNGAGADNPGEGTDPNLDPTVLDGSSSSSSSSKSSSLPQIARDNMATFVAIAVIIAVFILACVCIAIAYIRNRVKTSNMTNTQKNIVMQGV